VFDHLGAAIIGDRLQVRSDAALYCIDHDELTTGVANKRFVFYAHRCSISLHFAARRYSFHPLTSSMGRRADGAKRLE